MSRDLRLLTRLHIHQITTIPYENLSVHYRSAKENEGNRHTIFGGYMSLDPEYLFEKFVRRRTGRGGYCFQIVTFFRLMLRALGFQVYTVSARIRLRQGGVPSGPYTGWTHAVNIVTLADGSRYMVDACFGGDGPTKPLPLVEGQVTPNIGSQQLRLIYEYLPEQTDRSSAIKSWIYQYRNADDVPWNSYYAFAELEAVPADLNIANWYASQNPDAFQTRQVLAIKFLRIETYEDARIYGKVMFSIDVVKRNTGGKTELIKTCRSEMERVQALKEYFGISLTDEEVAGILGGETELRPAAIN